MELGLSGRTALVTGGSKGIGYAVAYRLVTEGCRVVLAARSNDELALAAMSLRKLASVDVQTFPLDTAESLQRDQIVSSFPNVDILVNNAGAIPPGSLDTMDDQHWRASWEAKVFGYINLTRSYLGKMKARKGGVIVNVIGIAGERPDSNYLAGCSGNAALMAFTRAVGGASLYDGVRVVGVNPGPVGTERLIKIQKAIAKTKFGDESRWSELSEGLPYKRAATPEEIANTVVFLASDLSSYTSGTIVNVDGGLASRNPIL